MNTVLVTRPEPAGKELCKQLQQQGIQALYHPLIDIEAGPDLSSLPQALERSHIVIAVSQFAVEYSHQYLIQNKLSWPSHCQYLAVGQKTASSLSKASGHKVHYPEISDSEHLLQLSQLQHAEKCQVLILRGNGGREVIYDTLTQHGAIVSYKEVYRRKERPFDSRKAVAAWRDAKVNTLVITSGQQLQFFVSQFNRDDQNWLWQQRLLVPSERIATQARSMGFIDVISTGSAHNSDLVAALQP
ncbi:uroporphyrinogen-III synthase [Vibrio nitrifigilis]|uniref:Uroporphyrinogen-III synthase n=1 Tax=Vibrio nitrifigilis TaxID=2789781 RepID=A0ABS0GHZ6_9VIBR|nr:uroporphyrinogen-III synthase [Vibrio nitrifigilis]MBF9001962.1 uroporphyrinogen-III synthase [Vibrio nitrifigilis]